MLPKIQLLADFLFDPANFGARHDIFAARLFLRNSSSLCPQRSVMRKGH